MAQKPKATTRNGRHKRLVDRVATNEDLAEAVLMLTANEAAKGEMLSPGTLARPFSEGRLHVLRDQNRLLGLCVDSDLGIDLVAVNHEVRRQGFGRELVRHSVERARTRELNVLEVDCISEASARFVDRLGFTVMPDLMGSGGGMFAYRELPQKIALPDASLLSFQIDFCNPARDYDKTVEPFRSCRGQGALVDEKCLHIPKRAVCYHPRIRELPDCIMVVRVGGQLIFEDKVKRDEAERLGVRRDPGGNFFIDQIKLT